MTTLPPKFEIDESRVNGSVRLSLAGDLDLAAGPVLEERLTRLRSSNQPVKLNLSRLEFIDSSGLHVLIRAHRCAWDTDWKLEIEREVSPQVAALLKLVGVQYLVLNGDSELPPNASRAGGAPPLLRRSSRPRVA